MLMALLVDLRAANCHSSGIVEVRATMIGDEELYRYLIADRMAMVGETGQRYDGATAVANASGR